LLLAADVGSNDLPEGDSGIDGRAVKRKVSGGKKRTLKRGEVQYMGYL
jgi:hypothetical protein